MTYEHLRLQREESVLVITIDRPRMLNALDATTRGEIVRALDEAQGDPAVRAVVITGAGERAFSAGQDLNESKELSPEAAHQWMESWGALYQAFRGTTKPLVAAVNGVAAGAGFQIALLCDVRVAARGARFGMAEINAGLPCILGSWLLWQAVGSSRTIELVVTGRFWSAEEAAHAGVVHQIVDDGHSTDAALKRAGELAMKPPVALRLNKRRFAAITEAGFAEAEAAAVAHQSEAIASGEPQKVMAEFFVARHAREAR